jgi:hypothetical protein
MMNAVVDRISGGIAVLLFGKAEYQVNVPVELLPEGTTEGVWLDVDFRINEKLTSEQYRKNKKLLDRIIEKNRKRPSGEK